MKLYDLPFLLRSTLASKKKLSYTLTRHIIKEAEQLGLEQGMTISTGATQRAKMVSVSAVDILATSPRIVWLICPWTSRNASSTITPIVPILRPKIHSVLLLHSFQLMIRSLLHFLETTMRIPQLILQVGTYSDLIKMFPLSFELLMVMLAMTRISMVTTLFFAFPPLILYSYYSIILGVSHWGC